MIFQPFGSVLLSPATVFPFEGTNNPKVGGVMPKVEGVMLSVELGGNVFNVCGHGHKLFTSQ